MWVKMMNNKNKREMDLLNNENFIKSYLKLNFEIAKKNFEESNFSVTETKEIATDIMNLVSSSNDYNLMSIIAKKIESWKNDTRLIWKEALNSYARTHQDILQIWIYENEIIVVVDSVISDDIIEHNDFCFDLMDKFNGICNFMIFDLEEFESLQSEFLDYKKTYQRG